MPPGQAHHHRSLQHSTKTHTAHMLAKYEQSNWILATKAKCRTLLALHVVACTDITQYVTIVTKSNIQCLSTKCQHNSSQAQCPIDLQIVN